MEANAFPVPASGVTTRGPDWANPGAPRPECTVLESGYELTQGYGRRIFILENIE